AAGTKLLKDINAGLANSSPALLKIYKNRLYFSADDGAHGVELWVTDGTEEGTIMLKDINPAGTAGSNPSNLVEYNGLLYFVATTQIYGRELWVSDGTLMNTYLFKDINPGPDGSYPYELIVFNDKLFFGAEG